MNQTQVNLVECKLGLTNTKRFPDGKVTLKLSQRDQEWMSQNYVAVSGWDCPMLIINGVTGKAEGEREYISLARAILSRYGFNVPDDNYVHRVNSDDSYDMSHNNLYIPNSLIPELSINSERKVILGDYLLGLDEAAKRVKDEFVFATCIKEGTRESIRFICDPEDQYYLDGTKVRITDGGRLLIFCEDLKFRSPVQEFVRRGLLGEAGASSIYRQLSIDAYDLRKGQIAVINTV